MRQGITSHWIVFVLPLLVVTACASFFGPSRAEFETQVVPAIASEHTDTIISAWKTEAQKVYDDRLDARKQRRSWAGLLGNIAAWLTPLLSGTDAGFSAGASSILKGYAGSSPESDVEKAELLALFGALDGKRDGLRVKLTDLFKGRIQEQDSGQVFAVCVAGKERRYARQSGFPRLSDGPGPCPQTKISLDDDTARARQGR